MVPDEKKSEVCITLNSCPPPPPPPLPPPNFSSPKRSPLIITPNNDLQNKKKEEFQSDSNDGYNSVIDEIKTKGGTLRRTKVKVITPKNEEEVDNCKFDFKPQVKPIFKNEIHIIPKPQSQNINMTFENNGLGSLKRTEDRNNCNKPKTIEFTKNNKTDMSVNRCVVLPSCNGNITIQQKPPAPIHAETIARRVHKLNSDNKDTSNINGFKLKRPSEFLNRGNSNDSLSPSPSPPLEKIYSNGLKQTPPKSPSPPRSPPLKINIKPLQNNNCSTVNGIKNIQVPPSPLSPRKASTFIRSKSGIFERVNKIEAEGNGTVDNDSTPVKHTFQRSSSVRRVANMFENDKNTSVNTNGTTATLGRRHMPPISPKPTNYPPLKSPNWNGSQPPPSFSKKASTPNFLLQGGNNNSRVKLHLTNEEAKVKTVVPVESSTTTSVDAGDPNVKKLVYNTYRNLIGAYNTRANGMVCTQTNNVVVQDKGVSDQVNKIIGPPAPPTQGLGHLPTSSRLRSEIPASNPEPPACVQNAMMTKDKKPFTYTPGGIDLSEIRSPRMAKRIERNAMAQGVGDVPRSQNNFHQSGPLPPSALAAMQTNMPVQVFPAGGPPPPPPPPPAHIPPPPPMQPLPTKPVATNDGMFDRPDMTRIIPENPMALLRKTPRVERKTFLDELSDMEQSKSGQQPANNRYEPPQQQQVRTPPAYYNPPAHYSPPAQTSAPSQPHYSPQPQYTAPEPQYSPQVQYSPHVQSPFSNQQPQYSPQPQQFSPQPQYQNQSSNNYPQGNHSPSPPANNNYQNQGKPAVGSLYIPPVSNNGNGNGNGNGYEVNSPPSPPQRQPQSPNSPQTTLNKAPKPWQNQKKENEQKPAWAVRAERSSPPQQQSPQAQYSPPSATPQQQPYYPTQQQPDLYSPQYQPQVVMYPNQQPQSPNQRMMQQQQQPSQQYGGPQNSGPPPGVERVYITQPMVFQHPGGPPQQYQQQQQPRQVQQQQQRQQTQPQQQQRYQQQPQLDSQGAIIIPIQIEGNSNNVPSTPSGDRNLNRQQSWTPTQSNSFKVLQKLTSTDGDDDNDGPTVEHAAKTSQQFNQTPADQIRRMKLSNDDKELVHKFKQDFYVRPDEEDPRYRGGHIPSRVFRLLDESDEENYLRQEVDPRYRGPAIPSKAFRLLQSMTDSSSDCSSASVPRGAAQSPQPQVRNIPIQIEGDGPPRGYVHPSEQSVPEPKKYTGSNIPGRSFKMLQSMTQGNALANYENYEPQYQTHTPPPYNMYPPPSPYYDYWNYYYNQPYPPNGHCQEREVSSPIKNKSGHNTPVPLTYVQPPNNEIKQETERPGSNPQSICSSCRNTPVPFWNYYYPSPYYGTDSEAEGEESEELVTENHQYPPQMWDPYYYPYYYYYPPPPGPPGYQQNYSAPCGTTTDTEDYSSTNEEIAYYTDNFKKVPINGSENKFSDNNAQEVTDVSTAETDCEDIEDDTVSEGTMIVDEPETLSEVIEENENEDSSDSDDEIDEKQRTVRSNSLQSIKSVTDMKLLEKQEFRKTSLGDTVQESEDETSVEVIRDNISELCIESISSDDYYEQEEHDAEYEVDEDVSEEISTEENDVPDDDDTIPHVLSVIYEESEFSYSCKNIGSRASSVLTVMSDETIVLENDEDEYLSDTEEAVQVKLPLKLTFTVNGDNEDVTEIAVGQHEINTCPNKFNESNDIEAVFIVQSPKQRIIKRQDSMDEENEDKDNIQNTMTEVISSLVDNNTDDNNCKTKSNLGYNEESIIEKQTPATEEVDFWSQIQIDEDCVPKRNRMDDYKNAIFDSEVIRSKTKETDTDGTPIKNTVNAIRRSSYESTNIKESANIVETTEVNNSEVAISAFEIRRESIDNTRNIKNKDKHDQGGANCETSNTTILCEEVGDALVKVEVQDYKLSNLVFERHEQKHVLSAPVINLDFTFKNKSNQLKDTEICETITDYSNTSKYIEDISELKEKSPPLTTDIIYESDVEEYISDELNDYNTDDNDTNNKIAESDITDSEEDVKTNDTLDTVKEAHQNNDEILNERRSTFCQIDDIEKDPPEIKCSTNSRNSSSLSRSSSVSGKDDVDHSSDDSDDESGDEEEAPIAPEEKTIIDQNNNSGEAVFEVPSIKDRIKSLQQASCKPINRISIPYTPVEISDEPEIKSKKETATLAVQSRATSSKSIDNSEDEGDSGVTSDMSRHISDSESEFTELRKLSKYQRAATHSRLFQLLQDDCSVDEADETEAECNSCNSNNRLTSSRSRNNMLSRREHLTLPLKNNISSESSITSSGINSPTSPLTDKLANELVLSLLRKKKGQVFRNMPMEKLHAAALKILQEDKDCTDLSSSEEFHNCLSPLRTDTECSTPAQTPKEFYCSSNYSDYYDSWKGYDEDKYVVPSKTFNKIQKGTKSEITNGVSAKCPRVPIIKSSLNSHNPDPALKSHEPNVTS